MCGLRRIVTPGTKADTPQTMTATPERPRVALFVTCLADMARPSVGFAALKLLKQAGCNVSVPRAQTCCGQPAYNSGDVNRARQVTEPLLSMFDEVDYVVAPSGSCTHMLRSLPKLFVDAPAQFRKAESLAAKSFELIQFLADVMNVTEFDASYPVKVTYHDACTGKRKLGIEAEPRKMLAQVQGLELVETSDPEVCCGFGGTFCVKYPEVSGGMVERKCESFQATGADVLVGGDLGCLLNLSGRLKRSGRSLQVRHVAEVLAGTLDTPPISEGST